MEDIDDTTDSNGYIYIPIEDSDSEDDDPASQLIFQNAHMSYQQILEQDARDEDDDIQLNIKMEENEGNLYENDYTGNNEDGVFDVFNKEITDSQINKVYDEEECNINESFLENVEKVADEEKNKESAIKEPTVSNEIDDDDYKSCTSDVSKADSVLDIKETNTYSYDDDICFNNFSPDLSTPPEEIDEPIVPIPLKENEDLLKNDSKEGDKDFAGFSDDEEVDDDEKTVISEADDKKESEPETEESENEDLENDESEKENEENEESENEEPEEDFIPHFKKEASIHEDDLLSCLNETMENMDVSFEVQEEEDNKLEEIPDIDESFSEENIEIINEPIASTSFDCSQLDDMEIRTVFSDHDYLSQTEITKMLTENHKRKMLASSEVRSESNETLDEKITEIINELDDNPISIILRLSKTLVEKNDQENVTDVLNSLKEQIEIQLNSFKGDEVVELESNCDSIGPSTEDLAFKPIIDENLELIKTPMEKCSEDSEILTISETVSQAVSEIAEFDITLSQISDVDISENNELCEKVKEIQTMSENVTKRCIEIIKNIQKNDADGNAEFDELVLLVSFFYILQ